MPTWTERFRELSAEQQKAWQDARSQDFPIAERKVKEAMAKVSDFFKKYEAAGSPDHDEQMPNS